jgi:anti-sigma B factor antagonist
MAAPQAQTRWLGPVPVVTVSGDIVLASSPAVRVELYAAIDTGATRVVVDLREVTFLDCSGLSVLVAARNGSAPGRGHRAG